jgi:hypothetical protein
MNDHDGLESVITIVWNAQLRVGGGKGSRGFAAYFVGSCWQWVRGPPERAGSNRWVNANTFPPRGFITTAMGLAV